MKDVESFYRLQKADSRPWRENDLSWTLELTVSCSRQVPKATWCRADPGVGHSQLAGLLTGGLHAPESSSMIAGCRDITLTDTLRGGTNSLKRFPLYGLCWLPSLWWTTVPSWSPLPTLHSPCWPHFLTNHIHMNPHLSICLREIWLKTKYGLILAAKQMTFLLVAQNSCCLLNLTIRQLGDLCWAQLEGFSWSERL